MSSCESNTAAFSFDLENTGGLPSGNPVISPGYMSLPRKLVANRIDPVSPSSVIRY